MIDLVLWFYVSMGFFNGRKGKGEFEMVEGVGNFVYDFFNEG